jgi:hypothetical protein
MWCAPSTSACQRQSVLQVDAQVLGQLAVLGGAAEHAHQRLARRADLARLAADGAGHVVLPPQLVEDRAADAGRRERAEGEPPRCVEAP